MKRHRGRCGWRDYAALLRMIVDQPGTTPELAKRFGMTADRLRAVLGVMAAMELICERRTRKGRRIWGTTFPPGWRPETTAVADRPDLVAFCAIVRTLWLPASSAVDIADMAGVGITPLRQLLRCLVDDLHLAYIEAWRAQPRGGEPVALYRWGVNTTSARLPDPLPEPEPIPAMPRARAAAAQLLFATAGRPWPLSRPDPETTTEKEPTT